MNQTILDISDLPDHAKNQLTDFYEFLKTKYALNAKKENRDLSRLVPRKVQTFTFLARDESHER